MAGIGSHGPGDGTRRRNRVVTEGTMAKATKKAARVWSKGSKGKGKSEDTAPAVVLADGAHSLDLLRPDPENPREITDEAREGLGVSLAEYGDLSGVVLNVRTGELVAGHQRIRQLRDAGAAEFVRLPGAGPGTDVARGYVDHPKSGERFGVRFVDWPRSKQRQANVVANSRAIAGHFTDGVDSILSSFQGEAPELFASLHMGDMLAFEPGDLPAMPGDEGTGATGPGYTPPAEDDAPAVAEGPPDSVQGEVYQLGPHRLAVGDCLTYMPTLPSASVDLILTDPPYFRVLDQQWDRQWPTSEAFLAWLGRVADEWMRLLKPNGSLYCFASVDMAARIECMLSDRFTVLNSIRWVKPGGGTARKACKEELRSYVSGSEAIIFCEQKGADSQAKREAGYEAKLDECRGMVFDPLRLYLRREWEAAGLTLSEIDKAIGCTSGSHYFSRSQWALPTAEHYAAMKLYAQEHGSGREPLRREYEPLRREYEELRRPFFLSSDVPYSDAWAFSSVADYPGKHPCEKPQALLQHIIRASSRPGALVLDSFAGCGSATIACAQTDRVACCAELDGKYTDVIRRRWTKWAQEHGQDPGPGALAPLAAWPLAPSTPSTPRQDG